MVARGPGLLPLAWPRLALDKDKDKDKDKD